MEKKAIVLIVLLICGMVFISGCTAATSIKSQEDVSDAVTEIGSDVNDLTEQLEEIDQGLGT